MDEQIAIPKGIINEPEGLLEVGSHFVAGNIERVYYFMVDVVLFGVADIEHGCRGEDLLGSALPERIFFCLSRFKLEAA